MRLKDTLEDARAPHHGEIVCRESAQNGDLKLSACSLAGRKDFKPLTCGFNAKRARQGHLHALEFLQRNQEAQRAVQICVSAHGSRRSQRVVQLAGLGHVCHKQIQQALKLLILERGLHRANGLDKQQAQGLGGILPCRRGGL